MSDPVFDEAYLIWSDFRNKLKYEDRFFIKHSILDLFIEFAKQSIITIGTRTTMFRARIFHDDIGFIKYIGVDPSDTDTSITDKVRALIRQEEIYNAKFRSESGFWGYDEKGSFIPDDPEIVAGGRVNPQYVRYLYVALEEYTALAEARPLVDSKISIAEILPKEDIQLIDFTLKSIEKFSGVDEAIFKCIMYEFSRPVGNNPGEYIATQFISEYIKHLGYDGIIYNSSLAEFGNNIAIFYPGKCEVVKSKLYEIESIEIKARQIAPIEDYEIKNHNMVNFALSQLLRK